MIVVSGALSRSHRLWSRLGLRGQLVALNLMVIAATVATILVLMHVVMQPSFMSVVKAAGQPLNARSGQRAMDTAVAAQLYPALGAAAGVAVILNFLVVTFALRPLHAVRDATRSLASGAAPEPIRTARQDEIGDVAESVNELARSLKRLEDLRRQVTTDVAHELRTPLHNLMGLLQGMRDGIIPTSAESLDRAHQELDRLIALVEDLRALADAQLARDRMERGPVAVRALVAEAMEGFAVAMTERELTWHLDPDNTDPTVIGDRMRLLQVVGIIVDNALHYATPRTAITARLSRPAPARVRVAITDIGERIPAEALPYVFERFFRADPSRTRGSGGAGIGLAIARELVDAHGGRVGAESDDLQTTFWFELPTAAAGITPVTAPSTRDPGEVTPERRAPSGAQARPSPHGP